MTASRSGHTQYARVSGQAGGDQFIRTPPAIVARVSCLVFGNNHGFDFDPCPADPSFDGLAVDWGQRNFVNPPYNDIARWLAKARAETHHGRQTCLLIPFRPTTRYFSELLTAWPEARSVHIFRKRLCFEGFRVAAPFLSCVVHLAPPGPLHCDVRFHVLFSAHSMAPSEVAAVLAEAGHLCTETEQEDPWPHTVFTTTTRDIGRLSGQATAHPGSVCALVPVRDTSRDLVPMYFEETGPGTVAFIVPHLRMDSTKKRSPFPSMLAAWPGLDAGILARAGAIPIKCPILLVDAELGAP